MLFCLRKSKIEVDGMEAEAKPLAERNEEGYWRVRRIDVAITAKLRDKADKERAKWCLEVFEKYCVVTEAIRSGIQVNVGVGTKGP